MTPQSSRQLTENCPKKIQQQLHQAPWFRNLSNHIQEMQRLQILFSTVCGDELAQHCRVNLIKNETLYLQISSAGWATRLRYQTPELLKSLKQFPEFTGIKAIQIKINSETLVTHERKLTPTPISQESAESIAQIAREIKDEPLRLALLKLAGKDNSQS